MTDVGVCDYCGAVHELGPLGATGGPFEGIRIATCPQIPDDHVAVKDARDEWRLVPLHDESLGASAALT